MVKNEKDLKEKLREKRKDNLEKKIKNISTDDSDQNNKNINLSTKKKINKDANDNNTEKNYNYISVVLNIFIIIIFLTFVGCIVFILHSISEFKKLESFDLIKKETIELNGSNFVELGLKSEFNDDGFKNKSDVIVSGSVDVSKAGKYIIKYSLNDSPSVYRFVNVLDKNTPTIALKGNNNVSIYVGDKYNDEGYKVEDDSGEDLNGKVEIQNNVDVKKVGKYTVKYIVKDSSGNMSTVERNVEVKNRPVPKKTVITKVISVEKGNEQKTNIDLLKNDNNIINMKFITNGFYVEGYVKTSQSKYNFSLCSSKCYDFKMSSKKNNYYFGDINLANIPNGTYNMKINSVDVVNNLANYERIARAKIGNKLVTFKYNKTSQSVTISDFNYEYDVLIDAGHGGSDPGASNSFVKEKDLNLMQSLYEKQRYEQHGLKVKMIRTDDSYGLMLGDSSEPNVRRRAYSIGYYGVTSRVLYSNHHNSINNDYYSGYEVILPASATKSEYQTVLNITNEWNNIYPLGENHTRIYSRNYDTGSILNKAGGAVYAVRNWYAIIRIPYELYNVNVPLYEGCYLNNIDDYNWYKDNWKKLSEVKIKKYVESLGKNYIPA